MYQNTFECLIDGGAWNSRGLEKSQNLVSWEVGIDREVGK